MTVCLTDALNSPIQGINIGFQMSLGGGTGSIDGNGTSGVLDNTTGPDGCAVATVVTNGMPVSTSDGFAVGYDRVQRRRRDGQVDIVVQLAFISNGYVGALSASARTLRSLDIRAYTTDGSPRPVWRSPRACSGLDRDPASATTGATGAASFSVTGEPDGTGTCTFTAEGVAPTITVGDPGLGRLQSAVRNPADRNGQVIQATHEGPQRCGPSFLCTILHRPSAPQAGTGEDVPCSQTASGTGRVN